MLHLCCGPGGDPTRIPQVSRHAQCTGSVRQLVESHLRTVRMRGHAGSFLLRSTKARANYLSGTFSGCPDLLRTSWARTITWSCQHCSDESKGVHRQGRLCNCAFFVGRMDASLFGASISNELRCA